MSAILDRMQSEIEADERRSYDEYLALVRSLANNEEPDRKSVSALLSRMTPPRTLEDLRKSVDLVNRRKALRAEVDAAAGAETRRQEAVNAVGQLDAELEAAKERHSAAVYQKKLEIDAALEVMRNATEARKKLQSPEWIVDERVRRRLLSLRSSIRGSEEFIRSLTASTHDQERKSESEGRLSQYRSEEKDLLAELLSQ